MADFTTDELTGAPAALGTGDQFRVGEDLQERDLTLKKREEASTSLYNRTFLQQALKNNTINKMMNWVNDKSMKFEPEEGYFIDDDSAINDLKLRGLPMKYFGAVRETTSTREKNHVLWVAQQEVKMDDLINNTLGDTGRTTASVVGTIADIDTVVGFGVGAMYSKSASMAKIMAYEGVAEASLAATHFAMDDTYTMEDAAIDMTIGMMVAGGATQLARSLDNSPRKFRPTDNDMKTYKWSVEDPLQPETAAKMADEIKVTADDLNIKREQELAQEFSAPEFDQYKANRESFFKTQERINAKVFERTKASRAASIDDLTRQIDELQIKVDTASTPAWKARYSNQLKSKTEMLQKTKKGLDSDIKKSPIKDEDLRTMRMADEMAKDVHVLKTEVDNVIKQGFDEDISELRTIIDDVKAKNPEVANNVDKLLKSEITTDEFKTVMDKMKLSDATRKKLLAVTLVAGGTSASASEGDSIAQELTGFFMAAIVLGLFGGKIWQQIRNPNINGKLHAVKDRMDAALHKASLEMSPQATTAKKLGRVVLDSVHTRFTSTVAPYIKEGGKAEEIMTKLVYSAKNGGGAEVSKAMWAHSTMFKYSKVEKEAFRAWKAEQGITRTMNFFEDFDAVHRFREEVTDAMELRRGQTDRVITSEAIKNMVAKNDEIMAEVWSKPKEYGVFGFDKLDYKPGMIPRMWKSGNLNNIVNNVSDDDFFVIRDSLANAIHKTSGDMDSALEAADRYMQSWKRGFDSDMNAAKVDDVFGHISGLLKEDVEFEDFADAMNVNKDKNARARYRLEFDINDLEPIEVRINGKQVTLNKSDFVERDYKSILDRTANSLYGSAALGKEGFSSAAVLTKTIDQYVSNPTMRNELKQVRDLVLGVPIPSNNKFLHEISMMTKDLTMVAKLPFVVFSMPPELIATLGNAGFVKGSKAVVDAVKSTFGKDSAMIDSLVDVSGLGTGTTRIDISGYRGLTDDITNLDDAGVVSKLREGTMKMRDFSMLANGLSYFSDVLQRANLSLNAEKFANYVNEGATGARGINLSRLRGFGIDEETVNMFKDTFTMNDKGRLASIDYSKWSTRKKDKFGEILRNMNQAVSPETTIGETGLYTRTTDLGRALSSLITYPMQQFNVHGVEDLRHMDRMAFLHSVGGFAGAYIGLQARYGVQNKEIDDEQVVMYALMNMPQLGALSSMTSMISPATLGTVNDAMNVVGMGRQ